MEWLTRHAALDWIAVAALVALTGQAAWEDFRTGRIRNALLGRMLLVFTLWLWFVAVSVGVFELDPRLTSAMVAQPDGSGHVLGPVAVPGYFLRILHNSAIALGIGVVLWFGRLWAAGDSKLFPLVVALLPLRFYAENYVSLWPGFVLFYNFVLATMLIILADLVRRGAQALLARGRARRSADPDAAPPAPLWPRFRKLVRANAADWGRFALMLLLVFVFIKVLRHYLGELIGVVVHLDATILYVVLFFACHPIIRLMRRNWVLIAAAAIDLVFLALALFTDWVPGLTVSTLLAMSLTAFLLMFFRMAYDAYQERMDYIEIEVDELRPKMILSEGITRRITKDAAYFQSQQAELGALLPDGLHAEQVPLVQRWIRERMPGTPVQIQKTFPMGPPIFLGLLLTILFGDYALYLPR